MLDIAAFFGGLVGTMIDPLTWGIVLIALYATRFQSRKARVITCVAVSIATPAIASAVLANSSAVTFNLTIVAMLVWSAILPLIPVFKRRDPIT